MRFVAERPTQRETHRALIVMARRLAGPMLRVLGCVLVAWASLANGQGSERSLRWQLAPGDELEVVIRQSISRQRLLIPAAQRLSHDVQLRQRWTVIQVSEQGVARVRSQLRHVRYTLSVGSFQVGFESDQPAADPLSVQLAALYRPAFEDSTEFTLDALGRIQWTAARGPEAGASSDAVPVAFSWLPPEPVAPGSNWKIVGDARLPAVNGTYRSLTNYSLVGFEPQEGRELGYIDYDLGVSLQLQQPTGIAPVRIVDQQGQGRIAFDVTAGHLVTSRCQQDLIVAVRVEGEERRYELKVAYEVDVTRLGASVEPAARSEQAEQPSDPQQPVGQQPGSFSADR